VRSSSVSNIVTTKLRLISQVWCAICAACSLNESAVTLQTRLPTKIDPGINIKMSERGSSTVKTTSVSVVVKLPVRNRRL
jgi:hypothetical protein